MLKKFTCTVLSVIVALLSAVCVTAASKADFSIEKADEYFTLMNGCSRMSLKNYGSDDVVDVIAYCGLDFSSPKIMFYLSMFYIANNIDTQKMAADPEYSTQIINNLNGYLLKKGIENKRASKFMEKYSGDILVKKLNFSTVGAYTFRARKSVAEKMLDDSNADFIIVGTGLVLKECDVNADGKIDIKDVKTIQSLSTESVGGNREDEQKFLIYSADLNSDGKININDATLLQQKLTA